MTIYFEGKDNDLEARRFFAVAGENGPWEITHPIFGFFGLQLVRVRQLNQPIESGNITALETEWIEPIDPDTLLTARELAGIIDNQVKEVNTNMAQQIADKIKQTTEKLGQTIRDSVDKIGKITDVVLGPFATATDALTNLNRDIRQSLNDLTNSTILDVQAIVGQLQLLIENPAISPKGSFQDLMDAYGIGPSRDTDKSGMVEGMLTLLPGGENSSRSAGDPTQLAINDTLMSESALIASICGGAIVSTANEPDSRAQAIESAQGFRDTFSEVLDALDAVQESTKEKPAGEQYFAQSDAYADTQLLVGQVMQLLLVRAFDLRVEKRFTLRKQRTPIEITIAEYGSLGENDENFDLFIRSNKLKGNEILMLPAGREVVVYI
jgi:hypothetical protein